MDQELYDLLTHAFDGWGSKEYFRWKYDQYPSYDPTADNLTISNSAGRIVAARRLFRHRLHTPAGGSLSIHIHGGTAVHEDYRGRGYYSRLLEESMELSEREADLTVTFNRAGKITTKHHKKNGWNWVQLPVYASIISPSRLFSQYMTSRDSIDKVTDKISYIGKKITANQFVSDLMATVVSGIYGSDREEPTPSEASTTAGEAQTPASSDGGTVSLPDYTISRIDGPVPNRLAEALHERVSSDTTGSYHFDRSLERMKHCLSYPGSTVFVAREADTEQLLDFVVAGTLTKGTFRECRILEQTWGYPAITQQLFRAVDSYGRQTGVDVIVACSAVQPGSHWVRLGTECMMWPPEVEELPTDAADWRITMCDIL